MNNTLPLALALSLAFPPFAATEDSLDEFFDIPLEQLLDIKVSASTKSNTLSLQEAPGVIRVFTRDEIIKYGFTDLKDLLQHVPGFQIQGYRAGHQLAWVRGVQSRYNSKVLWLIDGVPVRDSYYGHNNLDETLPLHHIEQIEIINGPGSVLFGANAFAGVVNIKTRRAGNEAYIAAASESTIESH